MTSTRKLAFSSSGRAFLLLSLVVLFLSGTSCLIYEIAWSRLIVQAFGSTLPAICTVVTVFLGGLALGAYISSKQWSDRGNPLLVCSCLELSIGVYAFFVPTICHSKEFEQIIAALAANFSGGDISIGYIPRFLTIALLLILPTTLMGATLPQMCRVYKSVPDDALTLSALAYALNTAGAVVGSALAGFLLLPSLGIEKTVFVGALINLSAACLCLFLSRGASAQSTSAIEPEDHKLSFLLCVLLGVSGALGMVLEVVWTRYFTLIMGSTTYAFAAVLIAVLLGLALGAALVSVTLKHMTEPVTTISVSFLATAMLAYLGMLTFGSIPAWYTGIAEALSKGHDLSFPMLLSIQFLTILFIVLPPTITNGIVFPLCLKALNVSAQSTARQVGKLYAANSLGSIAGAWLSGFVLIPWLSNIFASGIQASVFFVVLVFYVLALSTFYYCLTFNEQCGYDRQHGPDKRLLGSFVMVLVIFMYLRLPTWNQPLITSGLAINPIAEVNISKILAHPEALGLTLFYKEGLNSTVTVMQLPALNVNVLKNNGKPEAALPIDTDRLAPTSDISTQTLLGLLPILFHPGKAEDVLVIGFGSGMTCGSILQASEVKNLTCVELEKAVYEASKFFEQVNHKPLSDKRFKPVVADGANFLTANKSYDLIVSQPADPWVSGVSDLYTREFFRKAADRLKPNGLFCQWVQLYDITPEYLAVVLNTFQSVFGETYVFHQKDSAEIILIGSKEPYQIDQALLLKRFSEKPIGKELAGISVKKPQQVLDLLALTPQGVRELVAKVGTNGNRLNTNDNLLTEYQLPRLLSGRQRVCEDCLHMLIK